MTGPGIWRITHQRARATESPQTTRSRESHRPLVGAAAGFFVHLKIHWVLLAFFSAFLPSSFKWRI